MKRIQLHSYFIFFIYQHTQSSDLIGAQEIKEKKNHVRLCKKSKEREYLNDDTQITMISAKIGARQFSNFSFKFFP